MIANKLWFLPKQPGVRRVLFHAINHVGLGHMNRAIAVAQWLQAFDPQIQCLFLIEGGENFIRPSGFPWVMVLSQAAESENTAQMTRTVLEVFQPDLVIYETGLREPIYQTVRETGIPQVLMGNLGELLRGVLTEKLDVLNTFDMLLVLHPRDEVSEADLELTSHFVGKVVFAGPLVRRKSQEASSALRHKLGLRDTDKPLLLTFGGGGYMQANDLLIHTLATREQVLAAYPETKLVIVTGPHFSGELPPKDDFIVHVSLFEPFFSDFLDMASAIVCMAGYNTINEVVTTGIPAVAVPISESDDQVGKGGIAEYASGFSHIAVSSIVTDELSKHIIEALGKERNYDSTAVFQHKAEIASQQIVEALNELLDSRISERNISAYGA
jgi:UDP-N-acetylglucosamine--N-acetylmuramyl-(pentapeptide) pyrophosphoryl-undecaprenol N-acetylglucosamine transferase